MSLDRQSWLRKFQLVRRTWRALRPGEKPAGRRFTSKDFLFLFSRKLTDQLEISYHGYGWPIATSSWSLRVRIALHDRRVRDLRSEVITTYDTSSAYTLDFDILAAIAAIEGRELEPAPRIPSESSDDDERLAVKAISDSIDRIWSFAGGVTVDGVETLSIWIVRNRAILGIAQHFNDYTNLICTAAVCGELALSRVVLREYEEHIETQRPSQSGEAWEKIHATVDAEVERLRRLVS